MEKKSSTFITIALILFFVIVFGVFIYQGYFKKEVSKIEETEKETEVIDLDIVNYLPRDFPSVEGKPYVVWCENEETLEIEEDCSSRTEFKPGEALAVSFDLGNLFAGLGRENSYEEFYFCYSSDLLENNVTPLTSTCSMSIQNDQEVVVPDLFVPYLNEGTEINLFSLRIYPVREIGQLIDDPDDPQKIELINIKGEIMSSNKS